MTTVTPLHARRNDGLDTLRALAIALVFMYHYMCFVSGEDSFGWASTVGWSGVDLFFVLSGYLISNQLFSGIVQGRALSLKAYYGRRLLRTLPNFYVVLALYALFPLLMGGGVLPPLWKFLTFTQNIGLRPGTAFSHAWSLCIEEQFYLLLPAVILLACKFGKTMRSAWLLLAALILAGIATRSLLWLEYGRIGDGAPQLYYPNVYYSTLCRFDELLPGVGLAMLKNFHPAAWRRALRRGNATLAAGVSALALLFALIVRDYYIEDYGYGYFMSGFGYSLLALAFAALVLAALSPTSWLYRLRVPGAAHVAAWSYAIYLTHKPIAAILHGLVKSGALRPALEMPLIVLASLAGGCLLYRLVERPFMALRDRLYPTNFLPAARTEQLRAA